MARTYPWAARPFFLVCVATFLGCNAPSPKTKAPSEAEQAADIGKVFETTERYSLRTLSYSELDVFLGEATAFKSDSAGIRAFYERRKLQYAWFVNDSLSQSALSFLDLVNGADTAFTAVRDLRDEVFGLLNATHPDSLARCERCRRDLELNLTGLFFRLANKKYSGVVAKDLRELDWFIPRRKKDLSRLIDSLAAGRMDLSPYEPLHPQYRLLKDQLRQYHLLDSITTWYPLDLGEVRKLEPGASHPMVPDLRQRLMLLGDLHTTGDTLWMNSATYDSTVVLAVQRFQTRHGLHPDGVVGKGVVAALNSSPKERLRTLLVNMERLRWMPEEQAPDLILVNIPEFRMHVYENGAEALSMDVVVGNVATRTVIFSDSLSQIVFSPTWTIPREGSGLPEAQRHGADRRQRCQPHHPTEARRWQRLGAREVPLPEQLQYLLPRHPEQGRFRTREARLQPRLHPPEPTSRPGGIPAARR